METTHPGICRNCLAFCPIVVTVREGRAVAATGDPQSALYEGFSCPKGRALPEQHNDPARLLRCLRRGPNGFEEVASTALAPEIAAKVTALVAERGPRAIAAYIGTGVVAHPTGATMMAAYFRALGSPMVFSAATIDKPAANTSTALHGNWIAGAQGFETADVWMLIGANPVISRSNGAPYHNPNARLKEAAARGMKLIVVDPRRTETARHAHLHIQPQPGEDAALLAAMIHVVIAEKLYDHAFLADHARGLEALAAAVAPLTPDWAAKRAGVPASEIVEAARIFARGRRGCVVCSTGASFSTRGTLTFYLALCLNTLCGRWAREGDLATYPNIMMPAFTPRAEAYAPYPVFGAHEMRVRGLRQNASGMPTSALADEILTEGEGRVRALFCIGGNPLEAWPDQARARKALEALDLLVVFDIRMTATAHLAHYVVASPMTLEVPGATYFVEWLKYIGVSRGLETPWAQYAPKIVDPPAGADVMDDREFFFRLAQSMRLELEWIDAHGYGPHVESPPKRVKLDMTRLPSVDELIEFTTGEGRVPLADVKKHPHGRVFEEARTRVAAARAGATARLDLAAAEMLVELATLAADRIAPTPDRPFRLVSRRANNFMNSLGHHTRALNRGREEAGVAMHPLDMQRLSIVEGARVRVASRHGAVSCKAEADASLREGVVSMLQGYGEADANGDAPDASVTALIDLMECESFTGMPRLSAVPVSIAPV